MNFDAIRRPLEPLLRNLLHLYWRFSRGLTIGVRGLVVDGTGRVFLVKHSYVAGWHLPGGGVEVGETLARRWRGSCAKRATSNLARRRNFSPSTSTGEFRARDHVALYVVRSFHQSSAAAAEPRNRGARLFRCRMPCRADTARGTRERIAEVLGGTQRHGTLVRSRHYRQFNLIRVIWS